LGDVTHDDDDRRLSLAQTIRNVVEQGVVVLRTLPDMNRHGDLKR
jgi:hypothetical protein